MRETRLSRRRRGRGGDPGGNRRSARDRVEGRWACHRDERDSRPGRGPGRLRRRAGGAQRSPFITPKTERTKDEDEDRDGTAGIEAEEIDPDSGGHGGARRVRSAAHAESSLTAAPQPPLISGSDPDSPANDNYPSIRGAAELGSTVTLYRSSDCSGGTRRPRQCAPVLVQGTRRERARQQRHLLHRDCNQLLGRDLELLRAVDLSRGDLSGHTTQHKKHKRKRKKHKKNKRKT